MKKSTYFLILGILCFAEFFYLGSLTEFVKKELIEEYVFIAFLCLLLGVTCLIIWEYASSNRT